MTSKLTPQQPTQVPPRKSAQALPAPETPHLPYNTLSFGAGPGQGSFEVRVKTQVYVGDYLVFYFQVHEAGGKKGPLWYLGHSITATADETYVLVSSQVFKPAIGGELVIYYRILGTEGLSAVHPVKVVA